jgi:hypothetical protein
MATNTISVLGRPQGVGVDPTPHKIYVAATWIDWYFPDDAGN